jgi:hypothetical protein
MFQLYCDDLFINYTVKSCYAKLGLLKILVKSHFELFNLIYSSHLKFRRVEISGISK